MRIYGGTVTFSNCNIYSNTAIGGGGGVLIVGGTVTFTNCNIYANTAQYWNGHEGGGGVRIDRGTVTFTNCNIHNNQANYVSLLAPFGSSNAPMDALSRN